MLGKLLAAVLLAQYALAQSVAFPGPGTIASIGAGGGWQHYRSITQDHTKVPNQDATDFPVLFHSPVGTVDTSGTAITLATGDQFPVGMDAIDIAGTTYTFTRTNGTTGTTGSSAGTQTGAAYSGTPYLKTAGNGGLVQHTATQTGGGLGITVPADVIVTTDTGCTTKLAVEWESYSATTGAANFWFKRTLATASDTVQYLCYDDSSVTTYQGDPANVWNSGYQGIWHLADNAANTTVTGSGPMGNAVNQANTSGKTVAGKFGPALSYTATTDWSELSGLTGFSSPGYNWTVCAWVYNTWGGYGALLRNFSTNHLSLYIDPSAIFRASYGGSYLNTTVPLSDNTWYYLCVSDRNTGPPNSYIYINGSADNSYEGNAAMENVATKFGGSEYNDPIGRLDELRFSNVYRSADWIMTEYNSMNDPGTFYIVGSQN